MEEEILVDGHILYKFYSSLSYNGITVYIDKNQFKNDAEKKSFEKKLKTERDVVSIIYK